MLVVERMLTGLIPQLYLRQLPVPLFPFLPTEYVGASLPF